MNKYVVLIIVLVVAVGGYFGYKQVNSYMDEHDQLQRDLTTQNEKVKQLNAQVDLQSQTISRLEYESKQQALLESIAGTVSSAVTDNVSKANESNKSKTEALNNLKGDSDDYLNQDVPDDIINLVN